MKKLRSKFSVELSSRLIGTVASALLTVFLARLLSSSEYGLLFLSISILSVFQVAAKLGFGKSAARYISEHDNNSPKNIKYILKIFLIYNASTIAITCLILLFSSKYIESVIGEAGLSGLLVIGVLYLIFGSLFVGGRYILQGFGDIQSAGIVYSINRILRLLLACVFVLIGFGASGALFGYFIASFIATILAFSAVFFYHIPRNNNNSNEVDTIDTSLKNKIPKYAVPITATDTARVLDRKIDTVLIGFFVGSVGVASYTVAMQIIQFAKVPASALGFTISPEYNSLRSDGDLKKAKELYLNSIGSVFIVYFPAVVGIFVLSDPIITLIFGREYQGAIVVLKILSIYTLIRAVGTVTGDGLDYLGLARKRAYGKFAVAVVNVLLNILLIPVYGVPGAAIATVSTELVYVLYNYYLIKNELKFSHTQTLKYIPIAICSSFLMGLLINGLVDLVDSLIYLISIVFLGLLVWLLIIFMSRKTRYMIVKIIN